MKNLFFLFAFGAVASVAYFQGTGSCAFAAPNSSVPSAIAAPTDISTKPQAAVPEGWITDYKAGLAQAKAEGKSVLLDFTGSDWCVWCKRLDKEVFSQPEFEKYAEKNLVRIYLDFPNSKPQTEALDQQNTELAQGFGVEGFPTVIVLDSDGKPLAKIGYQPGGAEKYIETLEEIINPQEQS